MTGLVWAGSALALYTGATGPFHAPIQRGLFLLVVLPLVFLQTPSGWTRSKSGEASLGLGLSLLSLVVMAWTLLDYERLYSEPFISGFDTAVGAVGLLLIVEAVRRTVGWAVAVVLLLFLAYGLFGPWVPGMMLQHGGLSLADLVSIIFYGTFGVFGTPLGVCATFIVVIILLGSFLTVTGGAEMFMNIGKVAAGRFVGGPAKIAVVSSSLMGMITGDEIPSLRGELRQRGNMLLPIMVLIVLLSLQFSVMYAAFLSVACAMAVSFLRPNTRLTGSGFDRAFHGAMRGMLTLTPICAGAGIIIGVMTATGLNLKITYLIEGVSQGNLFVTLLMTMVACIVLGMGLPTVAAYVVLATLIPTTLTNLGVPAVAAHLFLFYFAILSAITPPVSTGAYVAAGIAGTDPIRTGFKAIELGLISFLLPFAFVYEPALLLMGAWQDVLLYAGTCALGIFFWAIALEGYFRTPVPTAARGALFTAGVMLIWPDIWASLGGSVVGAATLLMLRRVAVRV